MVSSHCFYVMHIDTGSRFGKRDLVESKRELIFSITKKIIGKFPGTYMYQWGHIAFVWCISILVLGFPWQSLDLISLCFVVDGQRPKSSDRSLSPSLAARIKVERSTEEIQVKQKMKLRHDPGKLRFLEGLGLVTLVKKKGNQLVMLHEFTWVMLYEFQPWCKEVWVLYVYLSILLGYQMV